MPRSALASVIRYIYRVCKVQDGQSDRQLLERFLTARDEDAFAFLVERHGPMVRATCLRLLGDSPDSEDAWQATFLILVRRAGSIRRKESLGGWLHQVARRVAAARLRKTLSAALGKGRQQP